jgi:hypothetical protein
MDARPGDLEHRSSAVCRIALKGGSRRANQCLYTYMDARRKGGTTNTQLGGVGDLRLHRRALGWIVNFSGPLRLRPECRDLSAGCLRVPPTQASLGVKGSRRTILVYRHGSVRRRGWAMNTQLGRRASFDPKGGSGAPTMFVYIHGSSVEKGGYEHRSRLPAGLPLVSGAEVVFEGWARPVDFFRVSQRRGCEGASFPASGSSPRSRKAGTNCRLADARLLRGRAEDLGPSEFPSDTEPCGGRFAGLARLGGGS